MKIALRYVGGHLPQGIVEVNEKKVEGLLARGDYILVSDERQKEKIDSDEKPNEKWKEDKINDWIVKHKINIIYDPNKQTKKQILEQLKNEGIL